MYRMSASLLAAAAIVLSQVALARAAEREVTFGAESYAVAHKDLRREGNSLVEFVRTGDRLESWQKLVAVHRFPDNEETPKDAVLIFASILKNKDPATRFAVVENPSTGEAMIDFLAGTPGSDTVELNVFKYARHTSGKGLFAFQFAQKFVLGEATPEAFKAVRDASVAAMATFDLSQSLKYLDE